MVSGLWICKIDIQIQIQICRISPGSGRSSSPPACVAGAVVAAVADSGHQHPALPGPAHRPPSLSFVCLQILHSRITHCSWLSQSRYPFKSIESRISLVCLDLIIIQFLVSLALLRLLCCILPSVCECEYLQEGSQCQVSHITSHWPMSLPSLSPPPHCGMSPHPSSQQIGWQVTCSISRGVQCLHRQPPSPGLLRKPGHGQSTTHRCTLALALAPPRPSTCLLSLYLHWFSVHCSRLTADKAAKQIIVDTTGYRCNCRRKPFIKLIHKYDCMIGVTADYYHDRRRYV